MRQAFILIVLTIASFTGSAQDKKEQLRIILPEENKWKIGSDQEDKTGHLVEWIPAKETLKKWTILVSLMSLKNTTVGSTDQVVDLYRESALKESPLAKLTVLETDDMVKNSWAIFKIETPGFPNDPAPESQLFYTIQGNSNYYVNFVAIKARSLTADFITRWTKVFKGSSLVVE